jgi:hypothetical protein
MDKTEVSVGMNVLIEDRIEGGVQRLTGTVKKIDEQGRVWIRVLGNRAWSFRGNALGRLSKVWRPSSEEPWHLMTVVGVAA